MSAWRLACFLGWHPRQFWAFMGSSAHDIWILTCVECGARSHLTQRKSDISKTGDQE